MSTEIDAAQYYVSQWSDEVLMGTVHEPTDRVHGFRILEEAAEIAQCIGLSQEDAIKQILYTYNRPVGESLAQEMAQLLINLLHGAENLDVDLNWEFDRELERIQLPEIRQKIFDKQGYKKEQGLF